MGSDASAKEGKGKRTSPGIDLTLQGVQGTTEVVGNLAGAWRLEKTKTKKLTISSSIRCVRLTRRFRVARGSSWWPWLGEREAGVDGAPAFCSQAKPSLFSFVEKGCKCCVCGKESSTSKEKGTQESGWGWRLPYEEDHASRVTV
jgi:hypothetical protein